jgi:hypothetical protein
MDKYLLKKALHGRNCLDLALRKAYAEICGKQLASGAGSKAVTTLR